MVEKGLPPTLIKHRGVFSMQRVLQTIHDWYEDNDYEFHEDKQKFKVPSPEGAERELEIHGRREINEYLRYKLAVYIHVWGLKEKEMIKNGEKIKVNEATILFHVGGIYTLDWQNRFGGNRFLQALQDFYHRYIINKKIEDYWEDNLFFNVQSMVRAIKRALEFEEMK